MKINTKLIITILIIILICNFTESKKNLRRRKDFLDSIVEFVFGNCVSGNGVNRGHSEEQFSQQEIKRCKESLRQQKLVNDNYRNFGRKSKK